MIDIRWTTVMLDVPAAKAEAAEEFWSTATGSTRSERRGPFVTLLPADGDPHVRIQRIEDGPRVHLDLHVDDPDEAVFLAGRLGADTERIEDGLHLLRSPAGIIACLVADSGERRRTSPVPVPGGAGLLDQVCLDVPGPDFSAELDFWRAFTGWVAADDPTRDLIPLRRPPHLPLRILVQRLRSGFPGAHLDLAGGPDRQPVVDHLQSLGAQLVTEFPRWTVLRDPAGATFCVTDRSPVTGLL